MKNPKLILSSTTFLLMAPAIQAATTLLEANFDLVAAGAVSDLSLSEATTGGSWVINRSRPNCGTIQIDMQAENATPGPSGDKALIMNGGNRITMNP